MIMYASICQLGMSVITSDSRMREDSFQDG